MKKIIVIMLLSVLMHSLFAQNKTKTENIILITLDGFRWQEVFNGGDSALMNQQEHLKDPHTKQKYWRDDLNERRKALLPFFWSTLVAGGQLYGNRTLGSRVNVTNNQWFSYPGYNEILTGKADDEQIHSNDKMYNPNGTVLEFLNKQSDLKGKVAAFTSWDVFPYIINDKRSGVFVSTGVEEIKGDKLNESEKMLNRLIVSLPNPLGDVRLDAFTFYYGLEYMKKNKPKVMYFSFDETDDFAHAGEYGAYLNSAHYTDRFVSELWRYVQTEAVYKNKTTIIITCDHGRGANVGNLKEWRDHGRKTNESDQIWFAVMGPDTKALGEVKNGQYYQNQIAKTMAAFMGFDYKGDSKIGEVVPLMLSAK